MRSGLIEVHRICIEKPGELLLLEDEEVIQAFSPHAAQKTFTDCIRLGSSIRRPKDLDAAGCCYTCKILAEFADIIPDEIIWCLPIRCCFSELLCHPRIGGRSRHTHVNDLPRLQLDDEKRKKWTKEEISDLQKIASPYLCCMIAEKGLPGLATSAFWSDLLHILLDGSFTYVDIQLEEFTPMRSAPQSRL